ncbi:MAG: DUF441 domain-containing protein [Firmicutes bacterium]|nr:DUF441 domain-containing protein [Bacillota bacterium]
MEARLAILAILVVAVLGRANTVAIAAGLLLLVQLLQVEDFVLPPLEQSGMQWGLVILTAAVLVPIAKGDITLKQIGGVFLSAQGMLAFVVSLLTTYLSGQGLIYLTTSGQSGIMPALILGAVLAAAFLGGVPVGPLITAGLISLIVRLLPLS